MSTSIIPYLKRLRMLSLLGTDSQLLNNSGGGFAICPYVNNVSLSPTNTLTDFTKSANTSELGPQTIASPSLSTGVNDGGQLQLVAGTVGAWEQTNPQASVETVYGWLLQTTGSAPVLLYAKSLDTPVVMRYAGQQLVIPVEVTLSDNVGGN